MTRAELEKMAEEYADTLYFRESLNWTCHCNGFLAGFTAGRKSTFDDVIRILEQGFVKEYVLEEIKKLAEDDSSKPLGES